MSVDYRVGDTREVVRDIADGSVDLIATSPPFLALRSYVPEGHENKGDEIGSERNPAEFIDMLLGLTAEWGRVLAPHGSIAIELGDTYSGSGGGGGDYLPGGLRFGQAGFDGSAAREHNAANWRQKNQKVRESGWHRSGNEDADRYGSLGAAYTAPNGGTGWPRAKSLALIPQLYAIALAYGLNPLTGQPSPAGRWLVRNVIVWHRPNPAVGALGDKVRPSTSYIVIATRSPKRWFDLTAVRTPALTGDRVMFQSGHHEASRQPGNTSQVRPDTMLANNPAGAPPLDAWFDSEPAEADPFDHYDGTHDTWTLTTRPSRLAHYAMWPAKLAERLVLMMCPAEVCTVCGEPRRRVERTLRTVNTAATPHGKSAGALHSGGPMTTDYTTFTTTVCFTHCGHDVTAFRPGHVLDPFAGSGTTLAVADLHGRDATGIDFDARNKALYPARYDEVKRNLYGTVPEMPGQMEMAL